MSDVACGIGLRAPHARAIAATRPPVGFLEVHSENFFAPGGASRAWLRDLRSHYPVSLHGVNLSLGSACGLDPWHLDQLAHLVREVAPVRVSDHAAFGRAVLPGLGQPVHANDLLPIAFTRASLDLMVSHVQQVQEALGCVLWVENLTAYVQWADADMTEAAFFNALMRRSGCGLLLDVNNLVVNELNRARQHGDDETAAVIAARACVWINALDGNVGAGVGEIHLAGHCDLGDIVIDDHASRVVPTVWEVYRHAVRRFGAVPALIEWDNDLPELAVLLDEARRADAIAREVLAEDTGPRA